MLPTRSKNKEVCFPVIQQNMPLTGSLDLYHLLSTHNRGRSSPHSMSNSLFGKEYECFLNNMELEFGPGIVDRLKSKFAAVSSSSAAVPTSNCTIPTSAQGGRLDRKTYSGSGPITPPSKDLSSTKRSSTNMTATVSPRKVDGVLSHKSLMNDNVVVIDRGSSVKLNSGLSAELVNKSECIEGLVSQYKAIFEKDPQALSNNTSSPQRKKRASRESLLDVASPPAILFRNSISGLPSSPHDVVDYRKSPETTVFSSPQISNNSYDSPPKPPPRPSRKAQLANQTKSTSPPQVPSRPVPPKRPPARLPINDTTFSNKISVQQTPRSDISDTVLHTNKNSPILPPETSPGSPPDKKESPPRPTSSSKKTEKEFVLPQNDVEIIELAASKKSATDKGPKSVSLGENNVQSQPGEFSPEESKKAEKDFKPVIKERLPRMTSLNSLQKGVSHPSRLGVDPSMSDGDKEFYDTEKTAKRLSLDSRISEIPKACEKTAASFEEQDTKDEKENTAPAFRVALKKSSGYGMTTIIDTKSKPITAAMQPALKIDDPALLTTLKDLGRTRSTVSSDDHDSIVELNMEILKIVVLGHNTPTGSRSSLKRPTAINTRSHLRITFNDKAITTHEYPSEQSLVYSDDQASPNSVLNLDAETEESDTDGMLPSGDSQVPRREGDLLRKTVGLTSVGLSSYKPSALAEFQLGLERPAFVLDSLSVDAASASRSDSAAQTVPVTSSTTSLPPSQRQHQRNKVNNQQDNDRRGAADKSAQWCVQPNSDSQGKFSNTASNADDMLF